MRLKPLAALSLLLCFCASAFAASSSPTPGRVLIVYNSNWTGDTDKDGVQDSLQVANYYAAKRGVPAANIVGVPCTNDGGSGSYYYYVGEYGKFNTEVVQPIKTKLTALGATNIDVILLCYGVPTAVYTPNANYGGASWTGVDNILMGVNYWAADGSNIYWSGNPYFAATPGFGTDAGHFDHTTWKFNSTTMYLVSRLDGPRGVQGALDLVDQALYGEQYVAANAGYYNGNGYIDSRYGQGGGGTLYTDAYLAAQSSVQTGNYGSYNSADLCMAYGEHFVTASGLPLKWENTTTSVQIGQAGAMFSDGTSGLTAPRALMYGGWYNYGTYHDVFSWLPGSVVCDLNSNSLDAGQLRVFSTTSSFGCCALARGATCVSGVVSEPYLTGHPQPDTLLYYMFKGYTFAEASALSTPAIGWMPINVGDPLYAPFKSKTLVKDTQSPALGSGYPYISAGSTASDRNVNVMASDLPNPEVVQVQVDFGTTTAYGTSVTPGQGFWRRNIVNISGLAASTTYHYRVTMTDPVGNVTVSGDYTFNTGSPTYTICGKVATSSGAGVTGVSITDGTRTVTSDSVGNYVLSGAPNGSYTLTPSLSGYTFSPATISVTVSNANLTGENFTATPTSGPSITTASPLPAGDVNAAYSQTFAATGGTAPYAWSLSSGTLPAGLNLSAAGVLSGTPTAAGAFNFTIKVTDNVLATGTKAFALTINAALSITTAALPAGDVGTAYSQTLALSGGTAPFTWSYSSGTLPPGLSISSAGVVSGTPTTAGAYTFIVKVTDAAGAAPTKSYTVTINATLSITTGSLPAGDVGTAYSQALALSGGTAPFTWSYSSGTLPPGVSISSAGVVSGTPTTAGAYTFIVKVTDAAGAAPTKSYTVTINATLSISSASPLSNGSVGTAYSQTLAVSGGTAPFTWTLSSGTLPAGLGLSSAGVLSGTPTVAGTSNFTVKVTDAAGAAPTKVFALTINPVGSLTITTSSALPGGVVGAAYSQTFAASGGTAPYTWAVTAGVPPGGLTLSSVGVLSGVPTAAGAFSFTVKATDSASNTALAVFALTITPSSAPVLTSIAVSPTAATVATGVSKQFTATALDQFGVALSPQPAIAWTATVGTINATGLFTAQSSPAGGVVQASSGAVSGTVSISVTLSPSISSPPFISGNPTAGNPITITAGASDPADGTGGGLIFNWNFGDGGTSSGSSVTHTFAAPGSYTITLTVTSGTSGGTVTTSITVNVAAPGGGGGGGAGAGNALPFTLKTMRGAMTKIGGHDGCSIAGVIPGLPALFDPTGLTAIVNVGGASDSFALDKHGRARNDHGSFALMLKLTRNKTTHKSYFAGGDAKFSVRLTNGTWAALWAAAGMDVNATAKNAPGSITISLTLNGQMYQIPASVLYSANKGHGAFKKK